jgi:hypothetical protein
VNPKLDYSQAQSCQRIGLHENSLSGILRVFLARLFILFLATAPLTSRAEVLQISDSNPLPMPAVGSYELRILTPTILELTLINTQNPYPARVQSWDFVDDNFNAALPQPTEFAVTSGNRTLNVQWVGFKRRPLYAPEKRDLRIANELYLVTDSAVANGETVEVKNPSGKLWQSPVQYVATMDPSRYSPAIHVNQAGYMPGYPKKAMVGYYLGSLGEMGIPVPIFQLIDVKTGQSVFQGNLTPRAEAGFSYNEAPYQKVYQADFTAFSTPGRYKLLVPGLGASFPFVINDGVSADFARTFALGLYHQRCGTNNVMPYTRHTHDVCHTAPAQVPDMSDEFAMTQQVLNEVSSDYASNPRHTAPQMKNVAASLYPFINKGPIDVSGGHHDAGDYSKYTINSAGLVHSLIFAADSFPGVSSLDNIGIPESGDGKSDMLQEAKWEADFLAKMQDADGGFYFLVYPKNRRYENNVLPENGDPQVVWPKTTAVTAAAVGALAEAGSSPLMKQQFPEAARNYLGRAQLGWSFLLNAIAKYGKDGSYQKITHYGNEFMHDDELAWAAAALYAATGDEQYQRKLFEFFPDPNAESTRRWSWWRLFEGYGCAVRDYAFAARSGRLPTSKLDAAYLAKCEAEIILTGDDQARWSRESAYGTSLPDTTKANRSPGWYFSSERGFDLTVAFQINPKPEYIDAVVGNFNFEGGCNPLNQPYLTGIGMKRQQEVVSQYAWNDRRVLPPAGLPQGNVRQGYGYQESYRLPSTYVENGVTKTNWINALPFLSFPGDSLANSPYPYYDRWTDMIDTMTEFVVMDMGRSYASLAFWMARGPLKNQSWKPVAGQITGINDDIQAGKASSFTLTAPGLDLSDAQVIWEVRDLQPGMGNPGSIVPKSAGEHWIEAEALLPDGRRVVAASNFVANASVDEAPNGDLSSAQMLTGDMAALYHLDVDTADSSGKQAPLALEGNAHLDTHNEAWMQRPTGGALRFLDLGDAASVKIPVSSLTDGQGTTAIIAEAMIYVNEYKAYARSTATIFALNQTWNSFLEFGEDKYEGPYIKAATSASVTDPNILAQITTKSWHHLSLAITTSGYEFKCDGKTLASTPSGDLANWTPNQVATLVLGNFDGWIDEVTVRSVRNNTAALPIVIVNDAGNGAVTYNYPATISLKAIANGGAGSLARIEFYSGESKIGETSASPYTLAWSPPRPGNYSITAKAINSLNQVGVSAPLNLRVNGDQSGSPVLTPISVTSAGFRFRVSGQTGVQYIIQASQDNKEWIEIGKVTIAGGASEFVDSTPGAAHKFYRVIGQ